MTSSPGPSVEPIDRLRAKFSVVMFAPNFTSAGSALSRSATASCARTSIASLRSLVRNRPPWFAFIVR